MLIKPLTIMNESKVNQLIEDVNKYLEYCEEYILYNNDFADAHWHTFPDMLCYHREQVKNDLEYTLDEELSDYEFEHIVDYICEGSIDVQLAVHGDVDEGMIDILSIRLNDQKEQLSGELLERVESLTDEEFKHFAKNVDWYVDERNKDLYYCGFGYGVSVTLYADESEIIQELKEYRDA